MRVKPALSLESGLQPPPVPWQGILGSCLRKPCQVYQFPELEVPMGPSSVDPRDRTENVPSRRLSPDDGVTWQSAPHHAIRPAVGDLTGNPWATPRKPCYETVSPKWANFTGNTGERGKRSKTLNRQIPDVSLP